MLRPSSLKSQESQKSLNDALLILRERELTEDETLLIKLGPSTYSFAAGLVELSRAGLLTPANRTFLAEHVEYARELAWDIILESPDSHCPPPPQRESYKIASSLMMLKDADLPIPKYKALLIEHPQYACSFVSGLIILKRVELLTDENEDLLMKSIQGNRYFVLSLGELEEFGLLTQENFHILVRYREFLKEIRSFYMEQQQRGAPIIFDEVTLDEIIDDTRLKHEEEKATFLMGLNPRVGVTSGPGLFAQHPHFDPKLLDVIVEHWPKLGRRP